MQVDYSKVANSELKILQLLWRNGGEMTMPEIRRTLTKENGWEDVTVKTLLYRLVDKGTVLADRREIYYYTPAFSERDYNAYANGVFLNKVYGGSARGLVASLIDARQLTQDDIAELRGLLREGEDYA